MIRKIISRALLISALAIVTGVGLFAGSMATVKTVIGSVMVQKEGSSSGFAARVGTQVAAGYVVSTGRGSRAVLQLVDGSTVMVKPLSSLTINKNIISSGAGASQTSVGLLSGQISLAVNKNGGMDTRIYTPTAIAAVRGTKFEVSLASDGSTVVMVDQGKVNMATDGGDKDLEKGQGGSVDIGSENDGVKEKPEDVDSYMKEKDAAVKADPVAAMDNMLARSATIVKESKSMKVDVSEEDSDEDALQKGVAAEHELKRLKNGGRALKALANIIYEENKTKSEIKSRWEDLNRRIAEAEAALEANVEAALKRIDERVKAAEDNIDKKVEAMEEKIDGLDVDTDKEYETKSDIDF